MYIADGWKDYEVLDTGDGEKLERWGSVILSRPDPQAIWPKQSPSEWAKAHARVSPLQPRRRRVGVFQKAAGALGDRLPRPQVLRASHEFQAHRPVPGAGGELGLDALADSRRDPGAKVLNLFGYTGGATVACAAAGARVTHVDAAKGMVQWAGENRRLCGLPEERFRWIVDDALKFVAREKRRGNFYDGILMDPPSYGRGPGGEVWKLEDALYGLVDACTGALSENAVFMLVNSYTTGLQPAVLRNILEMTAKKTCGGSVDAGEVVLPVKSGGVLPCGASGRWTAR